MSEEAPDQPTHRFEGRPSPTVSVSRAPRRKRLVRRLWNTAEQQVVQVENRLKSLGDDPMALEREAKTLAIIARTVRDLVAIDGDTGAQETRDEPQLGPSVLAIEDFRRELALKLEQLRGEGTGSAPSGAALT